MLVKDALGRTFISINKEHNMDKTAKPATRNKKRHRARRGEKYGNNFFKEEVVDMTTYVAGLNADDAQFAT